MVDAPASASPYDSKPWLAHYPKGVPAEIDLTEYSSLVDLVDRACAKYDRLPAFSNLGHVMSFAEVAERSRELAAFFQTDLGLRKGDRILIQMPNLLQYPIALFAALRAGLVVVNVNPLYTAEEMEHPFRDSGATAIVILENFADKLEAALPKVPELKHVILTEVGDLFPGPKRALTNLVVRHVKKMVPKHSLRGAIRFRDALDRGTRKLGQFRAPELTPADLAFLQYTGGTTGVSKAAMLSHRNLLANLGQMYTWLRVGLGEGCETVIAALPLYHVFCLTVNCFGVFLAGAHNVLITNPRDFPAFIKILAKTRPTVMTAVSTLLAALLNHPRFAELKLPGFKLTVCGGMALKGSVAKAWRERTGASTIEGYGLTEASPVISCNPLDGRDRLGTIGMPLPSTEVRVVHAEDGVTPVPAGEPGELCARGPQVMDGYWNRPEETAKVIDAGGWLHTGDIAVMEPDGYFRIVDRKKDMIIVSGFNVYPNEVEEAAMHHAKVLEAAAVGIPDERSGEAVKLFVVKRDPSLTAEELREFLRDRLTGYKRPREIEFRADLPKSNVGKVLRRELR